MTGQPILSQAEWELVSDLLVREQNELPVEIHPIFRGSRLHFL